MNEILIGSVNSGGATINMYAVDLGDGKFSITIRVDEGFADLRGFFVEGLKAISSTIDGVDTELDTTLAKDVNMKGSGLEYDNAYEIGSAGIGKDDIGEVTFTFEGSLAEIDGLNFGIRATSVGETADSREDSVKLVGQFDLPELPPPPVSDDFPVWAQDISNITLIFDQTEGDTKPREGDGYYTVKIDVPTSLDDDLDNSIDAILAALVATDTHVTEDSQLLGVVIKGGTQTTDYYAYGDNNTNGTDPDALPEGIGFTLPGDNGNVNNTNDIDKSYSYNELFEVV